ncbi:hypothetical protein SUGI_0908590 [Cryptomeria japonica]|nr:hypothetical protein SUGI_0908590 [Cryptomeria japonica]
MEMPMEAKSNTNKTEMPVVTKETLSRMEMHLACTLVCLSFFRYYIFLAKQGKSRAEEEAEQPRANSSSRHKMQNPASVHLADAERKKWEVPYDLLCNELIFSYTANPFGFAMKRRSHGEVMFNSSYGSLVFSIRYEIIEDLDVLSVP